MVKIGKISDSTALSYFRELDDFLKNKKDQAQKEIVEFIEGSLLKEIFEIHQEFVDLPNSSSGYQEILKKGNWFNIIDVIESLVVSLENPDLTGISIEDTRKLIRRCQSNAVGNINSISSFLVNFSNKMISYDIKNKRLVFNTFEFVNIGGGNKKVFDSNYDLSFMICEDESIFTNGIKLFEFSKISSIETIINNADDPFVFQFLKYVAGIITADDFALSILAEIENETSEIVSKWATSPTNERLNFHLFPAEFYSKEQIIDFLVNDEGNFRTFRVSSFFYGLYKSNFQNNQYLRMILDEAFNINNIKDDVFFSFLDDERTDLILGYSELSSEDKKRMIFSKFKEFRLLEKKHTYNIDIIDLFGDDEIFRFIKNTYKFLINKLKSDVTIGEGEDRCLLVDIDGESKYVKFYENFFSNHTYMLSESQLSELKSELIPLLEEVQDKMYIFCNKDKRLHFDSISGTKDVLQAIDIRNSYVFGKLFDILNWYPKKLRLVTNFLNPDDFMKSVEKFTFINKINESGNCDVSVLFLSEGEQNCIQNNRNYSASTKDWVFKRHVQLTGTIKRKISNGVLVSECCTENFEEKQKFLDTVLSYNKDRLIYNIEIKG